MAFSLEYAELSEWRRRRRRIVGVMAALVGLSLAAGMVDLASVQVGRFRVLAVQSACMHYDTQGTVACSLYGPHFNSLMQAGATEYPKSGAHRHTPCWRRFMAEAFNAPNHGGTVVLLHEMKNASGKTRLVCIEKLERTSFGRIVVEPGSVLNAPTCVANKVDALPRDEDLLLSRVQHRCCWIEWYSGHVDPNDPTHFIVPFSVGGCGSRIDGWLQNAKGDARAYRECEGGRSCLSQYMSTISTSVPLVSPSSVPLVSPLPQSRGA